MFAFSHIGTGQNFEMTSQMDTSKHYSTMTGTAPDSITISPTNIMPNPYMRI